MAYPRHESQLANHGNPEKIKLCIRPFIPRYLTRASLYLAVLSSLLSLSYCQIENETIVSMEELAKLLINRMNSQFPIAYSSTRVSPTTTQINVKWPACYGPRHATILSSFCVPGVKAGNNESISSVRINAQPGGTSQLTVFILSDDTEEGQVARFWAAEASNR